MKSTDRKLGGYVTLLLIFLVSCSQPSGSDSVPPAGFAFGGTAWTLDLLSGAALLKDTTITLEFDSESFDGYSGCNWYGGNYTVTGTAIKFTDGGSTAIACTAPTGVMPQEASYGSALYGAATYRVTDNRLELMDSMGTVTLTFTRRAKASEP